MTTEEKKLQLYKNQCETLKILLEHKAISKAQYDKSFSDLTKKMGMDGKNETEK